MNNSVFLSFPIYYCKSVDVQLSSHSCVELNSVQVGEIICVLYLYKHFDVEWFDAVHHRVLYSESLKLVLYKVKATSKPAVIWFQFLTKPQGHILFSLFAHFGHMLLACWGLFPASGNTRANSNSHFEAQYKHLLPLSTDSAVFVPAGTTPEPWILSH